MMSLRGFLFLSTALLVVEASQLRTLRTREESQKPIEHGFRWSRRAATDRRLQLNGGHMYIVSSKTSDGGTQWCMDAVDGTWVGKDGKLPNMGLRPCAFLAGPSEQLFRPWWNNDGLTSAFPGDFCLIVNLKEDGDRVRLGLCEEDRDVSLAFDLTVNGDPGYITVAQDPTMCVSFEGQTPEDGDRLMVNTCEDLDKFKWSFRSGWYTLYSEVGCVQVRDKDMSVRNRVIADNCYSAGFSGDWRLDGNGLFHSRLDDSYCMRATARQDKAPIRLDKCDAGDINQRWSWPDGFEAPITLVGTNLYLVTQGKRPQYGNSMVLGTDPHEYSGDAVHV